VGFSDASADETNLQFFNIRVMRRCRFAPGRYHRTVGKVEFLIKIKNQAVLFFVLLLLYRLFGNVKFFHIFTPEEADLGSVGTGATVGNSADWH